MIFKIKFDRRLELLLSSFLIGYALISYLIFIMGLYGKLDFFSFILLLCVVCVFAYPAINIFRINISAGINGYFKFDSILQRRIIYTLIFIFIFSSILNLLNALAPPTEGDSLAYHLGLPAYYLLNGEISFRPFYLTSAMPLNAEMWNLLSLRLGGGMSQIFQWCVNLVASLSLYLLVSSRFSKSIAVTSCVLLYILPINTFISSTAKSDSAFIAFIFMSLHFLILYCENKSMKNLIFSAVFTGLTLATKYQGINWALSIGITLMYIDREEWKQAPILYLKRPILFTSIALIVVSPWYLKNYFYTGDPIWPFGFEIFNSKFFSQDLYNKYSSWEQGPGKSIVNYILGLWNLTLNQSKWIGGLVKPNTPYILGFLPLLFITWSELKSEQKKIIKLIFLVTFIYYSIWFNSYQQMRYALPIMSLLLIPSSFAFWKSIKKGLAIKFSSLILFSFTTCFCLCYSIYYNYQFSKFLFTNIEEDNFLENKVSFYKDIEWANDNLPKNSKVFFTSLHTYYLKRNFILPYISKGSDFESMTPYNFLKFLKSEDITHIFNIGDRFNQKLKYLEKDNHINKLYFNPKSTRIKSRTRGGKELLNASIYQIE